MLIEAVIFLVIYLLLAKLIGISLTLTLGLIHLVVVPLIFKYSKTFQQQLVFLNYVQWPIHSDFTKPSIVGLDGARNLYLEHNSSVDKRTIKIGVWHILPLSVLQRRRNDIENLRDFTAPDDSASDLFESELKNSGHPIVMYCHGNANHRAAHHRVSLYQVLQKMDCHVIAFDYRGYGDSSFVLPTERGVVEDSLVVYDWLLRAIDNDVSRVFLWGHSLGSGIASHLLGNLKSLSVSTLGYELEEPEGLVLESPFNNLKDEVDAHPMTVMVRWLPYFETTFVRPFSGYAGYEFRSDHHLRGTSAPVLILHAKDDYVVPYRLGVKLYDCLKDSRGHDGSVIFHSYSSTHNLGHTWICLAEDLPQVFSDSKGCVCRVRRDRRLKNEED